MSRHERRAPGEEVRNDRVIPVGQYAIEYVLQALSERNDVRSQLGVTLVNPARLTLLDHRRRGVIRAAPFLELLIAVFRLGRGLVQPLQSAVVPLIEPPGAPDRHPQPPALLERERRGTDCP